ncbi:hypothetical protein DRN84_02125 [Candidatus Geothermarchaeota archaeon]|nr:MAG: hypothetical protein DRN84_02125 [Candidatus Geothermarchaeota archaeon]
MSIMRWIEPGSTEYCTPYCKYFRCVNRSILIRGGRRICKLTGENCEPRNCKFASCAINKLLPDGKCGLYQERVSRMRRRERVIDRIRIEDIEDYDEYMKGLK